VTEHQNTARASQQAEAITGFYIHFAIFVFVIALLLAVNWFATPEVWWVQWAFLGWGIGVLAHALPVFGMNFITEWQLRKIKDLKDQPGPARGGSIATTIGILVLAIMIGCAAGGSYMYVQLQDALEKVTTAEASRDKLGETVKMQEAQLKMVLAVRSSLDVAVKETREELAQLRASKQAVEQALQEARDQVAQAQSARDAADKALAEAKKGTPQ
jgi:uncharacterized membrane protein